MERRPKGSRYHYSGTALDHTRDNITKVSKDFIGKLPAQPALQLQKYPAACAKPQSENPPTISQPTSQPVPASRVLAPSLSSNVGAPPPATHTTKDNSISSVTRNITPSSQPGKPTGGVPPQPAVQPTTQTQQPRQLPNEPKELSRTELHTQSHNAGTNPHQPTPTQHQPSHHQQAPPASQHPQQPHSPIAVAATSPSLPPAPASSPSSDFGVTSPLPKLAPTSPPATQQPTTQQQQPPAQPQPRTEPRQDTESPPAASTVQSTNTMKPAPAPAGLGLPSFIKVLICEGAPKNPAAMQSYYCVITVTGTDQNFRTESMKPEPDSQVLNWNQEFEFHTDGVGDSSLFRIAIVSGETVVAISSLRVTSIPWKPGQQFNIRAPMYTLDGAESGNVGLTMTGVFTPESPAIVAMQQQQKEPSPTATPTQPTQPEDNTLNRYTTPSPEPLMEEEPEGEDVDRRVTFQDSMFEAPPAAPVGWRTDPTIAMPAVIYSTSRYRVPEQKAQIQRDWGTMGFHSILQGEESSDREWQNSSPGLDSVLIVMEGCLRFVIGEQAYFIEAGDELCLPHGTQYLCNNAAGEKSIWWFSYRNPPGAQK
eukprot:TRINITY_DN61332_c0_g1_i1.p1 TRINITY_DN61332_c0_g1~~TRINITY_DN61332_c0_g1_i1.p1  ORF type:complete len:593 (+),score=79.61 TRINITY_DN61332_c0_g1_i1:35-1813(+)